MEKSTKITKELITTIDLTPQDIEALLIESLKMKSHSDVSVQFRIGNGFGFLCGATVVIKDIDTEDLKDE